MRRIVLLAAFAVLVPAGSGGAGNYSPPPGDCCPQWSPHGTQIVFAGNRGHGLAAGVVGPTVQERFVPGIPVGVRSPDWTHVAYIKYVGVEWWLAVSRVDGSGERMLGRTNGGFSWSPDSSRIVFGAADGTLAVIGVGGSGLATVAPRPAVMPAWSPDDHRIAYVAGTHIHVADTDGSGDTNLTSKVAATRTNANVDPVWSPNGSRLAFWSSNGATAFLAVARIGGPIVTFRIAGAVTNGALVWAPDGRTVFGAGSRGLVGIDLATGKRRTLARRSNAVFSPNGRLIAFAAGGECRDRVGIYIANAEGTAPRRLTNDCRVLGTDGPDTLHGDFSRVVLGYGGNDTLYADDTYYVFDGNTLIGGPGDDRLIGGYAQDTLLGGPGNDTLTGGPSADALKGGPGHDHIAGDGGGDTIRAADGQRDWITCGKNGYGKGGRDVVYADRIDVVASDCEVVHRS